MVIDEAQDMDASEFALINALISHNEDMRVIAVGMMTRTYMALEVPAPEICSS